jgi:hypothetical protein
MKKLSFTLVYLPIICVFIIFLTLYAAVIINEFSERLKYDNFDIFIRNKTNSDIQIYIENKNNSRIISVGKKENELDGFYLNEKKWKSNNIWTFKFTMTANNSMFFQEIIPFPGSDRKIGSASARGGLRTFILIEDRETGFNITFKDFIPEDWYRW